MSEGELVALDPDRCPHGHPVREVSSWQPALFVGCDYGQATVTTLKVCGTCGWFQMTSVGSMSPRAFA